MGHPTGEPGAPGEIQVRSEYLPSGYHARAWGPDELADGRWFRTGDLGELDDSGNLVIAGRAKEVIHVGGFNVFPAEVETFLATHPSIEQRIAAIVKFAGGHDPGPLALPSPAESPLENPEGAAQPDAPAGPWGSTAGETTAVVSARPFLPPLPPERAPNPPKGESSGADGAGADAGPWGPHNPR